MKSKTISGHYDKIYNLDHNNRIFLPQNVDADRVGWNYNCVAAGQPSDITPDQPRDLREFWRRYRELGETYWSERTIYQTLADQKYLEHQAYLRRYYRTLHSIPHDPISALLTLLVLPLLVPCGIYLNQQHMRERREFEAMKQEQWLRDLAYRATKASLRKALYTNDFKHATQYLRTMDLIVSEMEQYTKDPAKLESPADKSPPIEYRYATLEEIYDKLYEPTFQAFQMKQRPCRRYNGTYLDQIREYQAKEMRKKQQTRNARSRTTAEAIEIVFGIGDMDNTGYKAAFEDAKKSETLLKDYCDHLLKQPNVCFVTTKELDDPGWRPPFRNGLIVLNLTVHADEATPGIHLTCIPYSRDCKRGPEVQASLGRAMAGMGYPSTWKDFLDKNGDKFPKKNKAGEIVCNKDGSIRYKQTPDKKGILDWIEEQKRWIQTEMRKRYDWDREYKGSHPRGNLDTPDYQAARARERREESERLLTASLENYQNRVYKLSAELDDEICRHLDADTNQETILRYLNVCTDEEYDAMVDMAYQYLDGFALKEQEAARQALQAQIQATEERRQSENIAAETRPLGR